MGQTTVRITEETHATLRALAEAEQRPMQALLEEAVEWLRRRRFLQQVNDAYGRLRTTDDWRDIEAQRREWDSTLADGLVVREGTAARRRRPKRSAKTRRTPRT